MNKLETKEDKSNKGSNFNLFLNHIKSKFNRKLYEENEKNKIEIEHLREKMIKLETIKKSDDLINNIQDMKIKDNHIAINYWKNEYEKLRLQKVEDELEKNIVKRNMDTKADLLMNKLKYEFDWSHIGDIDLGRPNLGNKVRVEVYRLMQFTMKDILEKSIGTEEADVLFYKSGKLAGKAFYDNVLPKVATLEDYIEVLKDTLIELGIGILAVESVSLDKGEMILTVAEDVDCSGLPDLGFEICTYDEGFIAALIESFTEMKFNVKEINCWAKGERICRFHVVAEE